jgi:hypothetical protein
LIDTDIGTFYDILVGYDNVGCDGYAAIFGVTATPTEPPEAIE